MALQQNSAREPIRSARQGMARSEEPLNSPSALAAPNAAPPLADAFPVARPNASVRFTFIDLFASIGGFRLGLQRAGGQCPFSCE